MNLSKALSVLKKSSPHAVVVEGVDETDELLPFKNYLYVETEIEKAFVKQLQSTINNQQSSPCNGNEIIFLCGSSGDGKSAILTRHKKEHEGEVEFHLDATHSFHPKEDAVQTLDKLFTDVKGTNKPLVVGINVGMIANYVDNGVVEHTDIKQSMKSFLDNNKSVISCKHHFLYFEDFAKFDLNNDVTISKFIRDIMIRLTDNAPFNPFIELLGGDESQILDVNFKLLSMPEVQDVII